MIKINTSTNTFRMRIALMKQIWASGKPGPTLYCCGGEIFLSFSGRIIQVAMVVAILNTYCHPLCTKHGIQPRVSNVYAFLEAVNMDRHTDRRQRISVQKLLSELGLHK